MKNKKGFTLIELLVVVLIIGILAAIAVPQYQKTVAKAELAQIISITKSIKQAQERYYLQTGQYANNISYLDLTFTNDDIKCVSGKASQGIMANCYNKNFSLWAFIYHPSVQKNHIECAAKTTDVNSAKVLACKDFTQGGLNLGKSSTCVQLGLDKCVYSVGYNF